MSGISFSNKGSFNNTKEYLKNLSASGGKASGISDKTLNSAGEMGCGALRAATPINTGLLASSWAYKIVKASDSITIEWHNTDIEGGENVALLVQYGHGTGRGTYVRPTDYINPAMAPVFDTISEMIWREVSTK